MLKVSAASPPTLKASAAAYLALMKPHVTVLLLGTTLAAMTVAVGGMPAVGLVVATLVGGAMAAGSANAINCYWDRDIDRVMGRTRGRPLPAGRISDTQALIFGIILGAASFAVLAIFVNLLAAGLALAAILFYVFVYTMWLKRSTPQNIVIGGAAGAVPVLVGWAAVTHSVGLAAVWMFLIIFLWTPPHFWALSLVLKKDYERAGVPMLPVVRGEGETHKQILLYTALLIASSLGLVVTHTLGYIYLGVALLLGAGLLAYAIHLARTRTLKNAHALFWFSNYYLALLFAAMVVDRVWR
ncbi:MAG TPA: heme o synthase [Ktedonobacterales bacterium]|jgi:protoheme IX farnesyltransferase